MQKDFDKEEELEYQSNENYPWEYQETSEVWVANFDILKKKKQEQAEAQEIAEEDQPELEIDLEPAEPVLSEEPKPEKVVDQTTVEFDITTSTAPLSVPKRHFSWLLASIILLFIVVAGEVLILNLGGRFYWTDKGIFYVIWLWRLILLSGWLWFGLLKWRLDKEQVFATAIVSFVLGVIVAAIWKILMIDAVWTWLNLLVEPIWMILLIALVGTILVKFVFRSKLIIK
jgi:hypothetical protein